MAATFTGCDARNKPALGATPAIISADYCVAKASKCAVELNATMNFVAPGDVIAV